jgi:hypothetical protein
MNVIYCRDVCFHIFIFSGRRSADEQIGSVPTGSSCLAAFPDVPKPLLAER